MTSLVFSLSLHAGSDKENNKRKGFSLFFSGLQGIKRTQSFNDLKKLFQRKKTDEVEKTTSLQEMPEIINKHYIKYREKRHKETHTTDCAGAYNQGSQLHSTDRYSIIQKNGITCCAVFAGLGGAGTAEYLKETLGLSLITTFRLCKILASLLNNTETTCTLDQITKKEFYEEVEQFKMTLLKELIKNKFLDKLEKKIKSIFDSPLIETIINYAVELFENKLLNKQTDPISELDILNKVSPTLFETLDEAIIKNSKTRKSGATATAALLTPDTTILFQLGNCAALHLDHNEQFTRTGEHSTLLRSEQQRIKDTEHALLEKKKKPTKKYLLGGILTTTRAFGYALPYTINNNQSYVKLFGLSTSPTIRFFETKDTDVLVLGSPGLFKNLDSKTIINLVKKEFVLGKTHKEIAESLVNEAYKKTDGVCRNITALIVQT